MPYITIRGQLFDTKKDTESLIEHILEFGLTESEIRLCYIHFREKNHSVIKTIESLKILGFLEHGSKSRKLANINKFLIKIEANDETAESDEILKAVDELGVIYKNINSKNWGDFLRQLDNPSYRPQLRAKRKPHTHRLDFQTKRIVQYQYNPDKSGKTYLRTKKQSATLLSKNKDTFVFGQQHAAPIVGLLFDRKKCNIRVGFKYDRGTYPRQ